MIDIPAESQVHKQIVRKRAEVRQIDVRPVTKLHYVDVREPDMHEPSGDLRRLEEALRGQWPDALADRPLIIDPPVLPGLQTALRREVVGDGRAPRGHEITAVSGSRSGSSALRSISAPPRSRVISATSRPVRCWRRRVR